MLAVSPLQHATRRDAIDNPFVLLKGFRHAGDLRGIVHLVKLLALGLLVAGGSQDGGVTPDLWPVSVGSGLAQRQTRTNLVYQFKEVTLCVRAIGRRFLVGLVKGRDGRVQDADRSLAES